VRPVVKTTPSGPGWLHEIKFDGYRVIARKDGA
jgi:ATP-dependent DNA ligase